MKTTLHRTYIIAIITAISFGILYFLSILENDTFGPIVALLTYGPLYPLSLIGLPVFATSESFGWGGISYFGWVTLVILLLLISYGIARLGTRKS